MLDESNIIETQKSERADVIHDALSRPRGFADTTRDSPAQAVKGCEVHKESKVQTHQRALRRRSTLATYTKVYLWARDSSSQLGSSGTGTVCHPISDGSSKTFGSLKFMMVDLRHRES